MLLLQSQISTNVNTTLRIYATIEKEDITLQYKVRNWRQRTGELWRQINITEFGFQQKLGYFLFGWGMTFWVGFWTPVQTMSVLALVC